MAYPTRYSVPQFIPVPFLVRLRRFIQRAYGLLVADSLGILAAFLVALALRFDGHIPDESLHALLLACPVIVAVYWVVNYRMGLYRRTWRYISAQEIVSIFIAVALASLLLLVFALGQLGDRPLPLSVIPSAGLLAAATLATVRYRQRLLTGLMGHAQRVVGSPNRHRVLIVGAGDGGELLAWQLGAHPSHAHYEVVGFVDDDPAKLGLQIHNARVLGDRKCIPELVAECQVDLIVIAIHRISGPALRDILSFCLKTQARVKLLPDFLGDMDNLDGTLLLKDIAPEDLLGRQACEVDETACRAIIADKTVLVTGAAGSIGSELCRQIACFGPRHLVMVDNNESGLYDLVMDLQPEYAECITPIIADVTVDAKMESLFAAQRPQVVFHAAAYKHVPLMEHHPEEAVRTNIGGTRLLADLAARYGVERFVLVSTDKAVNPSSIMGATKRIGEMLISHRPTTADNTHCPLFTAVRFGNVLGSRGSVVPTLTRQIERGGPVTVTHPEMTRYFMSIAEAVSLVIQAATLTTGDDIFMLDMGQEIRIEDLAVKMIRLRGLVPGQDIAIVHTGVRPGEKLHEELWTLAEKRLSTSHPKIFRLSNGHRMDAVALWNDTNLLIDLARGQRHREMLDALWHIVRSDPHNAAIAPPSQLIS